MSNNYIITSNGVFVREDELYHYGVPGMKWGVRKKQYGESDISSDYKKAKAAYKTAKKDYNDAFNKYYNKSYQAYSLSKKKRAANDERFADAINKGIALDKAKKSYKSAKETRRQAIKSAKETRQQAIKTTSNDLRKQASFAEKLVYNSATHKRAAKYVVDNNMTVADATKKAKTDAWRNSVAFVAGLAAVSIGAEYLKNR